MTYRRVIPRDLFNEASLLKCYGRLAILLDQTRDHKARLHHDGGAFETVQDKSDGSLTLWPSVEFFVGDLSTVLRRPLNSREPWPLYSVEHESGNEVEVFDEHGDLTDAFKRLIGL
jgi:hypothetical protein